MDLSNLLKTLSKPYFDHFGPLFEGPVNGLRILDPTKWHFRFGVKWHEMVNIQNLFPAPF